MAFDSDGFISEEDWAKHRREAMQALPAQLVGKALPDILMPSQKALLLATASNQLVVSDKSRRIGFTWAVGADAVLTAGAAKTAGGMDVLYIGYNLDMAREFIDVCAMWARGFMPACTEVGEFLFQEDKADQAIKAFRIGFASGFEIVALSSRPRSLRGRQGYVILDEFAFHDDPEGLLKAAMALLIWGGKVLVISTHNGVDNPFNELIQEVRAHKKPGAVVRCTFDQALQEGLYQRICLMRGIEWTPEGEAAFRTEIRGHYGADAKEELDCEPSQGSGVYLTRVLIEACATSKGPVLPLRCPDGFDLKPKAERRAYVDAWLEQVVAPEIAKLDKNLQHAFGHDYARSGHISCFVPLEINRDLRRRVPFVIEMRNVPYDQQKQVLFWVIERLPNLRAGKMDATGPGQAIAEEVQQRFGASVIEQVVLSQARYLVDMPPLKAAFEDRMVEVLAWSDHTDDLRQIRVIKGVAKVPDDAETKGSDGGLRHGDFAVGLMLAWAASIADASAYGYEAVRRPGAAVNPLSNDDPDDEAPLGRGLFVEGTI